MNGKRDYRSGRDICVTIFLITTMLCRFYIGNPNLFAAFAFISFVIAVYDIYAEVEKTYSHYRVRFLIVRGAFIVGAGLCSVVSAVVIICHFSISALVADELSILALLVSLPKDLYCHLLGTYLRGKGDEDL